MIFMKNTFTLLICVIFGAFGYAQNELDNLLDQQITSEINVVGIGDISPYPSKEISGHILDISKFLINSKNFKNIFIETTDIILRPLNSYINDNTPYEKEKIDSLIKDLSVHSKDYSFLNTSFFLELVTFLKNYNISNPNEKVNLYGTVYASPMPLYFLYKYVIPLNGNKDYSDITKKWTELNLENISDNCKEMVKWYNDNLGQINQLPKNQYYKNLVKDFHLAQTFLNIEKVFNNESKVASLIYKNLSNDILTLTEGKSIVLGRNHFVVKSFKRNEESQPFFLGSFLSTSLKNKYYSIAFDFSERAEIYIPKKEAGKPSIQKFIVEDDATAKIISDKTNKKFFSSKELEKIQKSLKIISLPYNFSKLSECYITLDCTDVNLLIVEKEINAIN